VVLVEEEVSTSGEGRGGDQFFIGSEFIRERGEEVEGRGRP